MYYNQASVKQVDVPSTSGTFGILAQHVPLLAALKPGVITVTEDDGTINKYFGMIYLLVLALCLYLQYLFTGNITVCAQIIMTLLRS